MVKKAETGKAGFAGHRTPNDWSCELTDTAKKYFVMWYIPVRAVMCLRVKNLAYLLSCKEAVTQAKVKEKLHQALFVDMDFEMVRDLAYGLRGQVETIMMEYKSHVKKGNEHGTKRF